MKLVGQHNYTNALAALAGRCGEYPARLQPESVNHLQRPAASLPLVHEAHGVRWINDSKATNVGSTEAALNGLQVKGTLWLLLGGDGKGADFTPLARYLQGDNVRLFCFGRDGDALPRCVRQWRRAPTRSNRR